MYQTTKEGIRSAAEALRGRIAGDFVTPADSGWDEARVAWNLLIDQQPAAVALPESADDVAEIVRFARANGYGIAGQTTGHNAGPLAARLGNTILVKTERLKGVEIDAVGRRARVGSGTVWLEVTEPAAKHGLAPLAGSSPDVGVSGYTLGGGISWMARRYGLSTNNVVAIEVVTADGEIVRADHVNHPDLFWAMRGGGGNFGVITAIELVLHPVAELYAGWLIYPIERSAEILKAWREWTDTVPEEVTSVGRILQLPPIPDIPEPLRGARIVVVEAAMIMDEAEGSKLLEPLRALGPYMDTFATIPSDGLSHLHQDPPHPVPGIGDHVLMSDLTPEAIDAAVEVAGADSGSPLLSVEFRHLGGELSRRRPENGATAFINGRFIMFAVGLTMDNAMVTAVGAHLPIVTKALAPYDSGSEYLNFAEHSTEPERIWPTDVLARLREVKAEYDPDDMFRSNHPVV
jgi:UDP-N-acetylenolpyruvoylglucosamine reductase